MSRAEQPRTRATTARPTPAPANVEEVPLQVAVEAAVPAGPFHCPYRRANDLLQRIAPSRMRVGFLLGAGCPLAVRIPRGAGTQPLIPDIVGLTSRVKDQLAGREPVRERTNRLWDRVKQRGIVSPTVEDVLSHLRTLSSVAGSDGVDGFTKAQLLELDSAICGVIRDEVKKRLPDKRTPYHQLARWIQSLERSSPVEVFTTNYDTLLEQALEEQRVPFFDGFVGSQSAFLDIDSMSGGSLPARWARLWKVHGSITWWLTPDKRIRRSTDPEDAEQLLIYPSHLKYDQSRQMPFLAMLERMRDFLRSGQCVLITCGYSFQDEHINANLGQSLAANPNASCIALMFNPLNASAHARALANEFPNFSLLASDAAIVGTAERTWATARKDQHHLNNLAVQHETDEGTGATTRVKWCLGDFAALGRLLSHQLANRDIEQEPADAP